MTVMDRLVGRDREYRLLDEMLSRTRSGFGSLMLIEGEAGSGKSSLLNDAAGAAEGFTVFAGAGHSIDRERPLGPIVDALGIRPGAEPGRAAVAETLRSASHSSGPDLMHRIADDVADLLERESTRGAVLLLLDDLQWADEATLLTVHRLARRIKHLPIAVVAACRPLPRPPGLDDIERFFDENGLVLRLPALDDDAVAMIARHMLGAEPGPRLSRLLTGAGGNPFFVTELVTALLDEGAIHIENGIADSDVPSVPREVALVILRGLGSLSHDSVRVLQTASILGTSFSAGDLAVVLGVTPAELAAGLNEPMRAGVVVEDGPRLRFRHDLVREALYQDLAASLRAALHHQVATQLAAAGARTDQVATHFAEASPFGDAAAVEWLRRAARESTSTSPAASCGWLSKAMELLPAGDERVDEIVRDLCPLLIEAGRVREAEELAREALARPQPAERRQALMFVVAWGLDTEFRCLEAAAVLEAESAGAGQTEAARIRLASKALEYRSHVDAPGAGPRARDLLPDAERLGDHAALSDIFEALVWTAAARGECVGALECARRAHEHSRLAGGAGKPHLVARYLLDADRGDEAVEILRQDLRVCEEQGRIRRIPRGLHFTAMIDWWSGRWDSAVAHGEAAAQLAEELYSGLGRLRMDSLSLLALIATRRNQRERAADLLAQRPKLQTTWLSAWSEATFHEVCGDAVQARDVLRHAWDGAARAGLESDLMAYGPDLVRLEMQMGDAGRARELAARVRLIAGRAGVSWVEGVALLCEGIAGANHEALADAAAKLEPTGRRIIFAAAAEAAATMLAPAGRTDEAVALLRKAAACHEESGAAWDLARVEAELRSLGVRRGKRGARARAATGWESLTDTEQRVAALAGEGLTNAETGARLFISGRTVEKHLSHVYAKLGISSRVELAVHVARASQSV
ncbi:MAG: helix-turn-helix transcriptional regulator [Actinomycetota bacterium]